MYEHRKRVVDPKDTVGHDSCGTIGVIANKSNG